MNLNSPLKSIGAVLRPDDALAKAVPSKRASKSDLLLRITLPKRTGRKRKRGSDHPFEHHGGEGHAAPIDSPRSLLRSMSDNPVHYRAEVVGRIGEIHRFRSLPDSQYATTPSPFLNNVRGTLLHLDPQKIRNFTFDTSQDASQQHDVGPPAHFTPRDNHDVPYAYAYKQNATVEVVRDAKGNLTTRNFMKIKQHFNHEIEPDAPSVPDAIPPAAKLDPETAQSPRVQRYIAQLRAGLRDVRPIMTKRFIRDLLASDDNDTRYAWAYCGYVFRSGPWRDALVKFGVDPRKDPALRKYQCLMFKIEKGRFSADGVKQKWQHSGEKGKAPEGVKGYQFDGKTVVADGKVYQLCDITDPILKQA
ncbi:MAG: hypothetical protein INR71_10705, partial [Terriglobus roseus]|nr:hypothetical protein [Terriglobus roseus]